MVSVVVANVVAKHITITAAHKSRCNWKMITEYYYLDVFFIYFYLIKFCLEKKQAIRIPMPFNFQFNNMESKHLIRLTYLMLFFK